MQTKPRMPPKQSSLFPTPLNQHHTRTRPSSLLQKKPQILLMKWNNLIEQYHNWKNIAAVNSSLGVCAATIKKKKDNLVIRDVQFIVSEQVSVEEKIQEGSRVRERERESGSASLGSQEGGQPSLCTNGSVGNSKRRFGGQNIGSRNSQVNFGEPGKMVVSVKIQESRQSSQESENFTDGENSFEMKDSKKVESTNKNSKINQSFQSSSSVDDHEQNNFVAQNLRKTAFFSFSESCQSLTPNQSSKPSQQQQGNKQREKEKEKEKEREREREKEKEDVSNQQNFNNLNKQIKSKKVEVLLKLNSQRETRRKRAQQVLRQDRQFLSKLMLKK